MKKLLMFETESEYISNETIEYPTVSLTKDTNKVWIKEGVELIYVYAKVNRFCLAYEEGDTKEIIGEKGMTWREWLTSEYNNIGGRYDESFPNDISTDECGFKIDSIDAKMEDYSL